MYSKPTAASRCRRLLQQLFLLGGIGLAGCTWLDSLKTPAGEGSFPAWSQSMGNSVRGKNVNEKEPQTSGLLFDKRSHEIEKSLGGNF